MHVVEVRREGDDVVGPMAQMRTWLDARAIQPVMFRMSLGADGTVFDVEFSKMAEARAFARAIGGILVSEPNGQPHAA